nr:RNA-directed DNA polymerase, eukaryota [Tanacetum cinerariifolium]
MDFEQLLNTQEYYQSQDYSMGQGSTHGSAPVDVDDDDSSVEEMSPAKKPSKRTSRTKKNDAKDKEPGQKKSKTSETISGSASGGFNLNDEADKYEDAREHRPLGRDAAKARRNHLPPLVRDLLHWLIWSLQVIVVSSLRLVGVMDEQDFFYESEEDDIDDNNVSVEGDNERNPDVLSDDNDEEKISVTIFKVDEQVDINKEEGEIIHEKNQSEEPFNIYSLFNKTGKKDTIEITSDGSMKYPPGFSPKEEYDENSLQEGGDNKDMEYLKDRKEESKKSKFTHKANDGGNDSTSTSHFKVSELPRTGGSILGLLDEVVKHKERRRYLDELFILKRSRPRPKGRYLPLLTQKAKKDWVKELCNKHKVHFLTLQETKMNNMHIQCVRACWGNLSFDYVHSEAVGNSGGILCVWGSNSFDKKSVTSSYSSVMLRGTWRFTGQKLLLIVVWKGEVVIMGDFNEVRCKSDRFGSEYNEQGAQLFNSFISDSRLMEINVGGCHYTWCHKSTSKMCKLDRFLVFENLLISYPHITAASLGRFLSDHRAILLRERYVDYGPTPFKSFHYWLDMEGFIMIVEDA